MKINETEFVNEIVKDICKEYHFKGDVVCKENNLEVTLLSEYTVIIYNHTIKRADVIPTTDCFMKIRREIVFGLNQHILRFFKRNM